MNMTEKVIDRLLLWKDGTWNAGAWIKEIDCGGVFI